MAAESSSRHLLCCTESFVFPSVVFTEYIILARVLVRNHELTYLIISYFLQTFNLLLQSNNKIGFLFIVSFKIFNVFSCCSNG
jgi:hypothetical protein